jgi:soluble lytic murein transglycosylase-like protein
MRRVNPHLAVQTSRSFASTLLSDARAMDLDPRLVMAIVTVESHWNIHAVSGAGAEGLGQLLPCTARTLGVDAWSGRSNLRGLTLYLRHLLSLFRDAREPIREAIAGYNAGPLAVERYGGVPPIHETRRYVAKVFAAWHAFKTRLPENPNVDETQAALDAVEAISREQSAYWGAN